MDFSVDIVVVDDDVIVCVEDHLTLGVSEGDMPALSTNICRGGGDGDSVQVLGIVEEESELQVYTIIWSLAQNFLIYTWEASGAGLMSRTLTSIHQSSYNVIFT